MPEPSLVPAISKRRIKIRSIIVAIIILSIFVAVLLWVRLNLRPSVGRIKNPPPTASVTSAPEIRYKTLEGKAISFKYLDTYQLRPALKVDPGSTEQYFLFILTPFSKHLAVAVELLTDGDLANNGAYKLRQTYPDKYKITNLPAANLNGKLVTGSTGGERVAFITQGKFVATLAFTSAGGSDDLDAEVKQVLESFKWK